MFVLSDGLDLNVARALTGIPGNIVTHLYLTYDTPCDPNVDLEAGITDHRQPPSHHWVTGVSS